jgi:uncharacterized protein (DUF2141 family)
MFKPNSRDNDNQPVYPRQTLQRHKQAIALAASLCASGLPSLSQAQNSAALIIEATGFNDSSGHAIAKLFLPGQNVRQHGHLEAKADIKDGRAALTFPAMPPGDYAVVVFHDTNDNGEIDHNLIGIPMERLGFSNAFKLSLASGLPTFDKLKFTHGASVQVITINVEEL